MATVQTNFIQEVAQKSLAHALAICEHLFPGGTLEGGREYKVRNHLRDEKNAGSFSINIKSGKWNDLGDSDVRGGDLVALAAYALGKKQLEAAEYLNDRYRLTESPYRLRRAKDLPVLPDAPEKNRLYEHHGNPSNGVPALGIPHEVFVYFAMGPDGTAYPMFADCIFYQAKWKQGKVGKLMKTTRPFDIVAHTNGEMPGAIWKKPPDPRPPYRLRHIIRNPKKPVLIVEGAKTANRIHQLLKESFEDIPFITTSWYGGSSEAGIIATDWRCLKGRQVWLLPDDDLTGREGILKLNSVVHQCGARDVKIIDPGNRGGTGWDLGDYTKAEHGPFIEFFRAFLSNEHTSKSFESLLSVMRYHKNVSKSREKAQKDVEKERGPMAKPKVVEESILGEGERPFRILGYGDPTDSKKNTYYIQSFTTQKIIAFSASEIFKRDYLTEIASESDYWKVYYTSHSRTHSKINWDVAGAQLKAEAQKMGVVNPDKMMRGTGCWKVKTGDNPDDLLVHCGDAIYYHGRWRNPIKILSKGLIFQKDEALDVPTVHAATHAQVRGMLDLAETFSWRAGRLAGHLAVGWAMAAPFCGYFDWRPHLLFTGESLSGKTTASRELVKRILGPFAIPFESMTTEAGMRRRLVRSALPVLFDEFENDQGSADRIRNIVRLLRAASSESGGEIQHGDGRSYRIRPMACLSSITPGIEEAADLNRMIRLELKTKRGENPQHLADRKYRFERLLAATPEDISPRLFWLVHARRALLRECLPIFNRAASQYFNNQRLGDTLAPVLSCLYIALHGHDAKETVSFEEAIEFMAGYKGWEMIFSASAVRDEEDLIMRILSVWLPVGHLTIKDAIEAEINTNENPIQVEEYDRGADHSERNEQIRLQREAENVRKELSSFGIKVVQWDHGYAVLIANVAQNMDNALKGTRWASGKNRSDSLFRTDGAMKGRTSFSGINSRFTRIPVEKLGLGIGKLEEISEEEPDAEE